MMVASRNEDNKVVARLNEIMVLTTLARSGNDPLYVSKIKTKWPIVHNLNDDEMAGFTKQGIKSACERLVEYGILMVTEKPAPKRTGGTPHYWIKRDLDTLFRIEERYGSYALDEVRNSLARSLVKDESVVNYLAKQLKVDKDAFRLMTEDIRTIVTMAKSSTGALSAFLKFTRPSGLSPEESRAFDLSSSIEKLKAMMMLEFLLGLLGETGANKQGWAYDVELKAEVSRGKASVALTTRLSSAKAGE
jgi:hypothetical protein